MLDRRRPQWGGKITFAMTYLPDVAQCNRFINADLITARFSPLAPELVFEQQGDQRNVANVAYYQLLLQESEL